MEALLPRFELIPDCFVTKRFATLHKANIAEFLNIKFGALRLSVTVWSMVRVGSRAMGSKMLGIG